MVTASKRGKKVNNLTDRERDRREERGIKLPSKIFPWKQSSSTGSGSRGQPAFRENPQSRAWIKVRNSGLPWNLLDLAFVKDFHTEKAKGRNVYGQSV